MWKLPAFLLTLTISTTTWSQRTFSTVSVQVGIPQGEYQESNANTGVGIRFNVLYKLSESVPLSIGGEVGFMVAGSDTRYFDLYYGGFYDRYQVSATSNIVTLAVKARADLLPRDRPIQVFVDGTIGTNLFYSTVDISQETFYGNSASVGGNSSKGYWAFIFGPGAGVEIPLGKSKEVSLVVKASYLVGATTKYLTDPYVDNNGDVFFSQNESKTDMIVAEAGVKFGLFGRRSRR